jgi:magnesium chelatase family protein
VPSILPPLSQGEAIEVTRVQSIAGLHAGGLVTVRPFRAPHHTVSASGLVGGGAHPMPGEATLAHRGVLFLDELSEFTRPTLEALRQPLEDGRVTIVRGQRVMIFPTRFMLVAASNPCPCGMGEEACRCTAADLSRHDRRLSGPLLDRIDLSLEVLRPTAGALRDQAGPRSAEVRDRVIAARERQALRMLGSGASCNAEMTARMLRELAAATPSALRLLYQWPHPASRPHDGRPRGQRKRPPGAHQRRRRPAPRRPPPEGCRMSSRDSTPPRGPGPTAFTAAVAEPPPSP